MIGDYEIELIRNKLILDVTHYLEILAVHKIKTLIVSSFFSQEQLLFNSCNRNKITDRNRKYLNS